MIQVEHLGKSYKKKRAVDDLSFSVETGKVTGFLGPNGSGKSTTMRLMLGLDNGEGTTTYDKKKLYEYSQPSKVVGILLEAKAFHHTRSARNHLRILAAGGGIPDKRVDEVLDIVGLSDVAKKKPGKFSLGMSQRLGIAAAILGQPKYLILDEPANGLDPEGIAWLREFIKDYAGKGNAVFVSSHLLSEMALMANDVVVIGRGKMIANTSISGLVASSSHSGVYVRSSMLAKLKTAIKSNSKASIIESDGGLRLTDIDTDTVGKLAFKEGIPLLELSKHNASLEEVFLEITEAQEEYKSHTKKGQK